MMTYATPSVEEIEQSFYRIDREKYDPTKGINHGFQTIARAIDRLGAQFGIRDNQIFRTTMLEAFEKSFGVSVARHYITGEQYDYLIANSHHVVIEIAVCLGANDIERLQRKRQRYIEETGIIPKRFILAVGSINRRRAEALEAAGFEVIDPPDDED